MDINYVKNYSAIFFLSLLFTLWACHSTNKTITQPSAFARTIRKANNEHRPFLMYSGLDTFVIVNLMMENSKRQMTVQLNRIDSTQRANLINANTLKGIKIALYMRDSTNYTLDEPHTIPVNKIARIELTD